MRFYDVCLKESVTVLLVLQCPDEEQWFQDAYDLCPACLGKVRASVGAMVKSMQPNDLRRVCTSLTPDQINQVTAFYAAKQGAADAS